MYLVYILNYQTYEVNAHSIYDKEKDAIAKMKELALNFMAHEEGTRRARILTEVPFDVSDIIKGYILFSPEPKKIDVYYKELVKSSSIIWQSEIEKLTKTKAYCYTKVTGEDSLDESEEDSEEVI